LSKPYYTDNETDIYLQETFDFNNIPADFCNVTHSGTIHRLSAATYNRIKVVEPIVQISEEEEMVKVV